MQKTSSFTRRQVLAATAATPLALMSSSQKADADDAQPNILYIMADDMGYADVSCFGRREYTTTNIDKLAAGGAKLLQAYANSAVCSATRTALITGRYQYRLPVGLEEPINGRSKGKPGLPPSHPTSPSLLKKVGYGTALVGKWHLGGLPEFGPLKSGYDHFWGFRGGSVDYFTHKSGTAETNSGDLWDGDMKIEESGYLTDLLATHAISAMQGILKEKKPFFISLHFNAPHWPWEGPQDQAESQRLRGGLADFDGGSMKTYMKMVLEMDAQIGRVVKAIEAAGVANNTIIIFTSDNGGERFADTWPFTGKKTELLEGGLRIPAIVHWPKKIRAKSTVNQTAITMDWVPTLLAAAGAQADPAFPLDGMSLLPALTENAPAVSRKLFWRFKSHDQQAMRDGDMKYLKIGANRFLFNVVEDPLERANLKDRQPDVYKRMLAEYNAWNATMLPLDPETNTDGFTGSQLADHFGVADD